MGGTSQRPPGVPDEATWFPDANEWRCGAVDAAGEQQGLHRSWRPDGTVREQVTFVDGQGVGTYLRFHPNGQIAGQGEFVDGQMQGTLRSFASDAPTTEVLQSCCVPPNAWELQSDFHHGECMARRWYNRAGQQILDSGAPHPPYPPSVPADARYDEPSARWVVGDYTVGETRAVHWRRWSREGVLVEEEDVENDARHGILRRYRETDGALCLDVRYERGLLHGPFRDDTIPPGVFTDARAVSEEGAFDRDLATGVWRLRDAGGAVIAERDLGLAMQEEALARSPALAAVDAAGGPAAEARRLTELAQSLRRERRVGEAIVAMARSTAVTGDAGPLRELLAQATWPRAPQAAVELATTMIERAVDRLAPLVDALVRGGDASALLRALAAAIKSSYRAALQIVDAALLLDPARTGCYVTRALINVHLGAPALAARDVQRLPADWGEQRTQLEGYVRAIFPAFDFWPARVAVGTIFEEYPDTPAQPLESVRAAVQKYATRLTQLRRTLSQRLREAGVDGTAADDASWLPPDLSALLPEGPLALEIARFEQSFLPDGEPAIGSDLGADTAAELQVETIAIDERLAVGGSEPSEGSELDDANVPALQRLARCDWAALCWLCWSCGLDRVALPEALEPPADFGPAAGMSIERTWRCRDKLTSGGLIAMTRGVPGFDWEGIAIDEMPRVLAEVMTEEYLEVRAMFLWLCDGTARSPWQSDLRDAD
jgi:hypothetical protein